MKILLDKISVFVLLILLNACSYHRVSDLPQAGSKTFNLKDSSGEFVIHKDYNPKGVILATKTSISPAGSESVILEKTLAVSKFGTVKKGNKRLVAVRPEISQHTVWLDKKKFFSQLKVNSKTKSLDVIMQSPVEEWNGKKSYKFPEGRIFCFFSQIVDCVKSISFLNIGPEQVRRLTMIWDSYPYHLEQYQNMVDVGPFQSASWRLESTDSLGKRYSLSIGNQTIFYHFNNSDEFETMYWIAQGITIKQSGVK